MKSRSVSDFGYSGRIVGSEPARVGPVSDFIVSEQASVALSVKVDSALLQWNM